MIAALREMLGYTFLTRALIVGSLVSLCAALLGVSLVLRRYSMIGDGLSHVGFGALAVASALNVAPLAVAIPVVIVAAFFLLRLGESSDLRGDGAVALLSMGSLSLGVLVVSIGGGNTDLNSYLFGSILAMSQTDLIFGLVLSAFVLSLFVLFYNRIFAVTFDEKFSRATGVNAGFLNTVVALLTALTIVLGMRLMGALLISSLVVFPALTSMRLCKSFRAVVICSAVVSLLCFFAGITVSFRYGAPTGASIVAANVIAFVVFGVLGGARHQLTSRRA